MQSVDALLDLTLAIAVERTRRVPKVGDASTKHDDARDRIARIEVGLAKSFLWERRQPDE